LIEITLLKISLVAVIRHHLFNVNDVPPDETATSTRESSGIICAYVFHGITTVAVSKSRNGIGIKWEYIVARETQTRELNGPYLSRSDRTEGPFFFLLSSPVAYHLLPLISVKTEEWLAHEGGAASPPVSMHLSLRVERRRQRDERTLLLGRPRRENDELHVPRTGTTLAAHLSL